MGTQQILLIVLSVIIVGVAIVVGIGMFNRQAYNSNAQAIAADARNYATELVQYWNTPQADGGAGALDNAATAANMTAANLSTRLFGAATHISETTAFSNENGKFWVVVGTAAGGNYPYVVHGLGKAERAVKNPKIATTVTMPSGTITAAASDQAVASGE